MISPASRPRGSSRCDGGRAPSRSALVWCVLAIALTAFAVLPASGIAGHNDLIGNAEPLPHSDPDLPKPAHPTNTPAFTRSAGESDGCPRVDAGTGNPVNDANGNQIIDNIVKTAWYRVKGTGRSIVISAFGFGAEPDSDFDTVIAVYDEVGPGMVGARRACNNNFGPNRASPVPSSVGFSSIAGRFYLVQAGGCSGACGAGSIDAGNLLIHSFPTPPANDRASAPVTLTSGVAASINPLGALEGENQEVLTCNGAAFGKTVWYRFVATAAGTTTFTSSGFDTVMNVYAGGNLTVPAACDNDGGALADGGSRVTTDVIAGGAYLVQVGGRTPNTAANAADGLSLTVMAQYNEPANPLLLVDADGDGYNRLIDCDDENVAVNPGAPEVRGNLVDENCDGVLGDRDGDGQDAPADCNDANAAIRLGGFDVPQNGIDDDCSGADAPYRRVASIIQIAWVKLGTTASVKRLVVEDVPAQATIEIRCTGTRCPFGSKVLRRVKASSRLVLTQRLAGQRFRAGNSLEVRITAPFSIGKVRTWRIRGKGAIPSGFNRCLRPGSSKPVAC